MSVRAQKAALAYDRVRKDRATGSKRGTRNRTTVPPVEPDNERLMILGEQEDVLLPGIPNEITSMYIVPKLPWRALLIISSVSPVWNRAFRTSRQYYNERVHSNSTETLAVVDVTLPVDDSRAIALYSVSDERFYYVPPIPGFRGFPLSSACASLDGKLYVLGGVKNSLTQLSSNEVYVLDLAGERIWRECASMKRRRQAFACGVLDGKIYAFGGTSKYHPVTGDEVYDPKVNAWSSIPHRGSCRFQHRVTVVGEELVLHGGMCYNRAYLDWMFGDDGVIYIDDPQASCVQEGWLLEFYNPITKRSRVVNPFCSTGMDIVSGTQGNFYTISWQDIHAHHVGDDDSWTYLRSFSAENVLFSQTVVEEPFTVTVVDDELLAVVQWEDWLGPDEWIFGSCLVRSRGYSSENNQISWEKAPWSGKHSSPVINRIICSIQL